MERQWSSYGYYTLVACDIYTQSGEYLGKVRDYEFDPETGILTQIFFDALGIPLLPARGGAGRGPRSLSLEQV